MRKLRKGFTLVELLIVIAVLGSLSGMMMYSSSGAVDSADAGAILSNLQSLKVAAMQMYMDNPEAASLETIALDGSTRIGTLPDSATAGGDGDTRKTIAEVLGSYLGKRKDALGAASKYGLIGDATSWYVVYTFDTNDSTGVKDKLKGKAEVADLYGGTSAGISSFTDYYINQETDTCIALKVR